MGRFSHNLVGDKGLKFRDDDAYYYDTGRDKWLSLSVYQYSLGAGSAATNGYLLHPIGGRATPPYAYTHPFDLVLVGTEYQTEVVSADAAYEIQYRSNGASLYEHVVGKTQVHNQSGLDVRFPANTSISFYANGTGGGKLYCTGYFRRELTL